VENAVALDAASGQLKDYQAGSRDATAFLQARTGQSVNVFALGQTMPSDAAEFFVDDFSLTICAPPGPPTKAAAISTSPGQATVSFTAPAFSGCGSITAYTVTTYNNLGHVLSATNVSASPATVTGLANGTPYYFSVAAVNSVGSSAAIQTYSVTPLSGTSPPARGSALSRRQYTLPNSDGTSWQPMDESALGLSMTPSVREAVLLSASVDVFTSTASYNQDVGISVNGTVVAWKESGGFAGTFSPNAAFVETVYSMAPSTAYRVEVVWKTSKPALGVTVLSGAGPAGGPFSPTFLSAKVLPSTVGAVMSKALVRQFFLQNSDGSTWQPVDATNLSITLTPSATEDVVLSANADMWTMNAGYNQDLGIIVSGGAYPTTVGQPEDWKESGGFAGTFSPNAAYVQTIVHLTGGVNYTVRLVWKASKKASGAQIAIGAGGSYPFSPTRLTAWQLPAGTAGWASVDSTQQYQLANSNGTTFMEMDATKLATTFTTVPASEWVFVDITADLWTGKAGINQDLAVFVSDNGVAPTMLSWEESGGFSSDSPNAATLQVAYLMLSGHTYVFSLRWKASKSAANSTIWAGAGPINGKFSPTRITVVHV
jgi:hypothetical protein